MEQSSWSYLLALARVFRSAVSFDLQEKKLFRQAELEQKVSSIRVPGSDILFFLVVPSILGLISRLALIIKNTFSKFRVIPMVSRPNYKIVFFINCNTL